MFEYYCDNVIKGCTATERGETNEEAVRKVREHLMGHHGSASIDADTAAKIKAAISEKD